MPFVQGDLDVAILFADGAGVVVGIVDAGIRQADVVHHGAQFVGGNDLSNALFDLREQFRALLHPGADRCAHVHHDLPGIHAREKISPQKRHQRKRQQHEGEEAGHEGPAVLHRQPQQAVIAGTDLLETRLETALKAHQRIARRRHGCVVAVLVGVWRMRLEQVHRHGRHQRARQDERGDHREHHRFGHRHEQEARHACKKEHRHKHDAYAQQRDEGRRHDLSRAIHDGRLDVLALLQVPVDVLDGDRSVVHQDTHRQCQASQRHDVQCLPHHRQRNDRAKDRQRDRHGDDHGGSPAAEEQQDHQAGQCCRNDALARHATDGRTHEQGLIADRRHLEVAGEAGTRLRKPLLDTGHDGQRGSRAVLEHAHQDRAMTVDVHDVGLWRAAVVHVRDVADIDGGAVDGLDRKVAKPLDVARRVVQLQGVFEVADFLRTHRSDQVLCRQRMGHILGGKAACLQRRRIDVDLHFAGLATGWVRKRSTGYRGQPRAQQVQSKIAQLLLAQPLARQRQLQDRHSRGVVVDDHRRVDTRRQLLEHGLRYRRDLRVGSGDVDRRLEENLDDAEAGDGLGLDVLHIVDRGGQHALVGRDDAACHLVRRQTGVLPYHRDHRNIDVGKDVCRCAQRHQRSDDQDQQGENNEGIGSRQGEPHNSQHEVSSKSVAEPRILPCRVPGIPVRRMKIFSCSADMRRGTRIHSRAGANSVASPSMDGFPYVLAAVRQCRLKRAPCSLPSISSV